LFVSVSCCAAAQTTLTHPPFLPGHLLVDEQVKIDALSDHSLRLRSPKLCDPDVKQCPGYLRCHRRKTPLPLVGHYIVKMRIHAFLCSNTQKLTDAFFAGSSKPAGPRTAASVGSFMTRCPLDHSVILTSFFGWLEGPGCSSSTGPLGLSNSDPAQSQRTSPRRPPRSPSLYSQTEHANVTFLDQPVNVGFSYSPDGSSNSPAAAKGVWAFLILTNGITEPYTQFGTVPQTVHIQLWDQ
jgi:Serine carboxypeptidase